jgi:transposase
VRLTVGDASSTARKMACGGTAESSRWWTIGESVLSSLGGLLMSVVGGLDLDRRQITFDCLDTESGEVSVGRVVPADREHLRLWLRRFDCRETVFAVEACTGWRFVVEELERVGSVVHLAEPADTAALRGRKRRAKTDRVDARHLRELVLTERVPESWIPPAHVSDARTRIRL